MTLFPSSKLQPFEFEILKRLESLMDLRGTAILVACSGGADSVALLHFLTRVSERLDFKLSVAHVNHGLGSETQTKARRESDELVRRLAQTYGLPFFKAEFEADSSRALLSSENDLRLYRHGALSKIAHENKIDITAFGHHADDLLETRLMRLIRGTGANGLTAMEVFGSGKLRPFLEVSAAEIRAYALANHLEWIEDPSNQETRYFRNWVRHSWLPQLEERQPGALKSLGRSLETLAAEVLVPISDELEIRRDRFESLSLAAKRAQVSGFAAKLKQRDFSRSRVDEVIKRLHHLESIGQKRAGFLVGKIAWKLDDQSLRAEVPQTQDTEAP